MEIARVKLERKPCWSGNWEFFHRRLSVALDLPILRHLTRDHQIDFFIRVWPLLAITVKAAGICHAFSWEACKWLEKHLYPSTIPNAQKWVWHQAVDHDLHIPYLAVLMQGKIPYTIFLISQPFFSVWGGRRTEIAAALQQKSSLLKSLFFCLQ